MSYSDPKKQAAAQAASDAKAGRTRIALVVSFETKQRWQQAQRESGLTAEKFLTKLLENENGN